LASRKTVDGPLIPTEKVPVPDDGSFGDFDTKN
jgi:hypothetical protein